MSYRKLILFVFAICLFACNKTSEDGVSIRIQNSTSQDFKEVLTNNKTFTNVKASDVTSYQLFDKSVKLPWARLINNNNDTAFAGALYTDPPVTYLDKGKYTLKIFTDSTALYGYNCVYIKD